VNSKFESPTVTPSLSPFSQVSTYIFCNELTEPLTPDVCYSGPLPRLFVTLFTLVPPSPFYPIAHSFLLFSGWPRLIRINVPNPHFLNFLRDSPCLPVFFFFSVSFLVSDKIDQPVCSPTMQKSPLSFP